MSSPSEIYKFLWSRIGKRMWTYIMRDFAYQNPLLMFLIGFAIGLFIPETFQWHAHDILLVATAFLAAHLFWGTKYRKGEGLKRRRRPPEKH